MRTTRTFGLVAAIAIAASTYAQNWVGGGNGFNGTQYLGINGAGGIPLRLTTVPNTPIEMSIFNLQRARLNGNLTGPIGPTPALEFPNINRDGFFLLSGTADAFTNTGSRAPFTRLHLVDNAVNPTNPGTYAQQQGFRPWQRNGITFTGNSDQSYIGQRYDENDNTDFVIQWSDNPNGSPWGVDRMKFVFTTQFNGTAPRGAATLEGLEAMRFWPRNNTEVNVGIGDFAPPAVGDPTERLDMLDGRLRIRQLPDDPETSDPYLVMVVDNTVDPERGVVKWVDPLNLPGNSGVDCDWEITANTDVVTAYDPNPTAGCPGEPNRVGIGLDLPMAKLHVEKTVVIDNTEDRAAFFHNQNMAANAIGADGLADAENPSLNIGTRGAAFNAARNYGVNGIARASNETQSAYGVFGTAQAGGATTTVVGARGDGWNADRTYGVSGTAIVQSGNMTEAVGVSGSALGTGGHSPAL